MVSDSGVRGTRRGGLSAPGLAKRRELEKSGYDDDASPTLGYEYLASKAGLSQAELEIISKHTDQIHLEFVVKMAIACVVLVCLVVWFAWSFWRDSRRRRGGGSHRRSVNRQDRELEPPGSLDSSVGTPGSIPSNAPAAYQRDALALGDQDSNVVTEFLNPLWVSGRREDGADTAVGGAGGVEARGEFGVRRLGTVWEGRRHRCCCYCSAAGGAAVANNSSVGGYFAKHILLHTA